MNILHNARPTAPIAALLAVLAVLPLAGCLGGLGTDDVAQPMADLKTSDRTPWSGEAVTFDGQASTAPDGAAITQWRFDFGDGTVVEVDDEDEARLSHIYAQAGLYTVTLTVESRKGDDEPSRDDTTLEVGVADRVPVRATLVKDPLGLNSSDDAQVPVVVREDATGFVVNLTVTGSTGVGMSRGLVEVIDPTGAALASEAFQVDAGQSHEVRFDGPLARAGTHELRLSLDSGAVDVGGLVEVHYLDE